MERAVLELLLEAIGQPHIQGFALFYGGFHIHVTDHDFDNVTGTEILIEAHNVAGGPPQKTKIDAADPECGAKFLKIMEGLGYVREI